MPCEPHAVRWTRRMVFNEYDYTRWHYTQDASWTVCGISIPVGIGPKILPETSEVEDVDCDNCLRIMLKLRAEGEKEGGDAE